MSLIIDYRPSTFDAVFGNESLVRSLEVLLRRDLADIPNAFLFTGPSGCGKTTIGRILAATIGAEGSDFSEQNAADFRGIDSVRDILRKMSYRPVGSARVYFLDEAHMLTKEAQTALLKGLEHPPDHVTFILATTDPGKLIPTLRNRCTSFEVAPLIDEEIEQLVVGVVEAEGKKIPKKIREQIVSDSLGCPRVALTVLDQIIDLPPDEMSAAATFRAAEESEVIELCRALTTQSWKKVSGVLKGIKQEPESVRRAVLGYFSSFLLNSGKGIAYHVLDCFSENYFDTARAGLIMSSYEVCHPSD